MVARVPVHLTDILGKHDYLPTPRATMKALPTTHHPPSPLRIVGNTTPPHPAGDHEGPPFHTSSSLAPTDSSEEVLIFFASSSDAF